MRVLVWKALALSAGILGTGQATRTKTVRVTTGTCPGANPKATCITTTINTIISGTTSVLTTTYTTTATAPASTGGPNAPCPAGIGSPFSSGQLLYQIYCNVDFFANDLPPTTADTFADCIAACSSYVPASGGSKCVAVSWTPGGKQCYLKSGIKLLLSGASNALSAKVSTYVPKDVLLLPPGASAPIPLPTGYSQLTMFPGATSPATDSTTGTALDPGATSATLTDTSTGPVSTTSAGPVPSGSACVAPEVPPAGLTCGVADVPNNEAQIQQSAANEASSATECANFCASLGDCLSFSFVEPAAAGGDPVPGQCNTYRASLLDLGQAQSSDPPGGPDAQAFYDLGCYSCDGSGSGTVSGTTAGPTNTGAASTTASGSSTSSAVGPINTFQCGPQHGNQVCGTGFCCSRYGFCGQNSSYCGVGCQPAFGDRCDTVTPSSTSSAPVALNTFQCGPQHGNQVCGTGFCCSRYGFCGRNSSYCGTGCQPDFGAYCGDPPPNTASSTTGSLTSSGTLSSTSSAVGPINTFQCGPQHGDQVCGTGYCCSRYGFCGRNSSYCGTGCQPTFGDGCGDRSTLSSTTGSVTLPSDNSTLLTTISNTLTTLSTDSLTGTLTATSTSTGPSPLNTYKCGPANGGLSCSSPYCCSRYGFCGTNSSYCGSDCLPGFGNCNSTGTSTATAPGSTTTCGPTKSNTVCAAGYCCSRYGNCGKTDAYCGTGCQPLFGSCNGTTTLTASAAGPTSTAPGYNYTANCTGVSAPAPNGTTGISPCPAEYGSTYTVSGRRWQVYCGVLFDAPYVSSTNATSFQDCMARGLAYVPRANATSNGTAASSVVYKPSFPSGDNCYFYGAEFTVMTGAAQANKYSARLLDDACSTIGPCPTANLTRFTLAGTVFELQCEALFEDTYMTSTNATSYVDCMYRAATYVPNPRIAGGARCGSCTFKPYYDRGDNCYFHAVPDNYTIYRDPNKYSARIVGNATPRLGFTHHRRGMSAAELLRRHLGGRNKQSSKDRVTPDPFL